MGRARIVRHIAAGQYEARPLMQTRERAKLDAQIRELDEQIDSMGMELTDAQNAVAAAKHQLNSLVTTQAGENAVEEQIRIVRAAESALSAVQARIGQLKVERANAEQELQRVRGVQAADAAPLWCADYNEDLSGDVDTIELDGQTERMVIAPSGVAPILSGPALVDVPDQSPAQAFYNWAIFPGWQRWKPTYRTGVIEKLQHVPAEDRWVFEVRLDAAQSKAQGLPINPDDPGGTLTVAYQDCDHLAFKAGDRVIIAWPNRDFSTGVVIGFLDNPRPCLPKTHVLVRFGSMAMAYCVETDMVIMPPTEEGSEAWLEWYNRLISVEDVGWPYTSAENIVPGVLSAPPDYYDDTRDGHGIDDDVEICSGGSCFRAYLGGFENEPHGECLEGSDRDEAYERAARWKWAYRHMDNQLIYWQYHDGWKVGCIPSLNVRFSTVDGGMLQFLTTVDQEYEENVYFPCTGDHVQRTSRDTSWEFIGFASEPKLSGRELAVRGYDGETSVTVDWFGPGLIGLALTDDVVCQFVVFEHGSFEDGTYGDVQAWASATCDYAPDEARDISPIGRAHNAAFADAVAAAWMAWRAAQGYASNDPYTSSDYPGHSVDVVRYAPDPERGEYPYVIE